MKLKFAVGITFILLGYSAQWVSGEKQVVCYLVAWAVTRQNEGRFSVDDARDAKHCTHVIYAFMGLDEDTSKIKSIDKNIDLSGYNQLEKLRNLKNSNPNVKISVSVGGYNEKGKKFSDLARDPNRRKTFIDSVLKLLRNYNLDGLDICWQFPGSRGGRPDDIVHSVTLFNDIKQAFKPDGFLLSVHILGKRYIIDQYNIEEVAKTVDFINLIPVEFSGPWERTTGIMAPLKSKNENNVEFVVEYILKAKHCPPSKIMLGLPLYGHAFILEEPPSNGKFIGLFSDKTFMGPWTNQPGVVGFHESCKILEDENGWKQIWHQESCTPIAFMDKKFISYDNERSLLMKADLINSKSLGGVMFWSLDMDDFHGLCFGKKFPVVTSISDYINGKRSDSLPKPTCGDEGIGANLQEPAIPLAESNGKPPHHSLSGEPIVACYIAAWSAGRPGGGKFSVLDTDTSLCTHVIYAFMELDESSNKLKEIDNNELPKLKELKKRKAGIKLLVSIGGWNQASKRFSKMAESPEKRSVFIESVMEFLRKYELDGLDICWQFPTLRGGKSEDKENSLVLFKEIKDKFKSVGFLLTVHILGQKNVIDCYDIKSVSEIVDFINLATVDYHGPKERIIYPTTPFTSSDEFNVKYNLDYVLSKKVDRNKILLGLPTYGHAYLLAEIPRGKYTGIFYDQPATSQWTNEPGLKSYNELCDEMKENEGWTEIWEDLSQTPIAYYEQQLVSYDNEKSLKIKAKLVKEKQLGGVMIWSLDMDDFSGHCNGQKYPLVTAITEYIKKFRKSSLKTSSGNSSSDKRT